MLRGLNQLRRGRFREGWSDYASREGIPELYPDGQTTLADQEWQGQGQGQALAGKTLLVTDDQGHGDAIQFFRYLPYPRPSSHLKSAMKRPAVRRLAACRAMRVGLVWSGDPRHTRDHLRSVPAELFPGLPDVPGISVHSLRHEVRRADLPALGKPVWLVLHVAPDWRWMADRTDSPWYPTVRLFRVAPAEWLNAPGASPGADWAPVLDRVATALRALSPP